MSSLSLTNVHFTSTTGDETRPAVDVRCEGTCRLHNVSLDDPRFGVSWSGSGTSVMDNVSVNALDQAVEASGAGHAVWSALTASAKFTLSDINQMIFSIKRREYHSRILSRF